MYLLICLMGSQPRTHSSHRQFKLRHLPLKSHP